MMEGLPHQLASFKHAVLTRLTVCYSTLEMIDFNEASKN